MKQFTSPTLVTFRSFRLCTQNSRCSTFPSLGFQSRTSFPHQLALKSPPIVQCPVQTGISFSRKPSQVSPARFPEAVILYGRVLSLQHRFSIDLSRIQNTSTFSGTSIKESSHNEMAALSSFVYLPNLEIRLLFWQ